MKNLIIISLLSITLFACNNNASLEEALAHNEEIVKLQTQLIDAEQDFVDAFIDGTLEDAKNAKEIWKSIATDVKSKTEKIKPIDDQDEMRKSLIKLSEVHIEIIENQVSKLLTIVENSEIDEVESSKLTEKMNNLFDEMDSKSRSTNEQFLEDQQTFAKRYDIQLR